ncbi:uncharacterized protein EI90DRAFT_3030592 [Cantharellus anzutake]|uniref:uncharacterized protein n=1 Tax=Cantharellus anzutake TaxID=1750568 RepID=UPI001907FDF9|nr:uncharacterized protein EI90DRAFT_3030592 [Cantharellus anzutake]KAF8342893.1 hypothetical protein EI90DRAFT_3030592 [Cantharellus anzutake]
MFPLQTVMKELHLRNVHLYPRFHQRIQDDLQRRRADTVELYQQLSPTMMDIHTAIVECMNGTLSELKRSNMSQALDLDDLNVENAYFRSFDALVRRQLDPVWHKVGVKTKQLVADIIQLRKLLSYLLSYDPVTFLSYVETVRETCVLTNSGGKKQPAMLSAWLMTDAANVIFTQARRRVYIQYKVPKDGPLLREDAELEEAWNVLDEIEGRDPLPSSSRTKTYQEADGWQDWMPSGMGPVLEDLPKWKVLSDILDEVEQTMSINPASMLAPGSDIILIMANDHQTCGQLREFLSTKHLYPATPGRHFLEARLLGYLHWKKNLRADSEHSTGAAPTNQPHNLNRGSGDSQLSEGLRKKDTAKALARANRRRVRGGAPGGATHQSDGGHDVIDVDAEDLHVLDNLQPIGSSPDLGFPLPPEAYSQIKKESLERTQPANMVPTIQEHPQANFPDLSEVSNLETPQSDYGLLPPDHTIIIRPYGDDSDDMMLAELRPRWIIMYEPSIDFIRRVEVYRSLSPGLALRLYFMVHQGTSEEHKYLAGIRKEKHALERLIDERAKMVLALDTAPIPLIAGTTDHLINAISSRNAGGQGGSMTEPPRILVDIREFRSSLPNLLNKARNITTPLTLTVGDYILTPDIVVERKSLPDLVQSLQSGRLYNQCELMSAHYRQPVLLIEFEENKSFSMQSIVDTTSAAKRAASKTRKVANEPSSSTLARIDPNSVQSKLVLLTLHFPRLRIIWSSSPHATVGIFADLKSGVGEPDPERAVTVGTDAPNTGEGGRGTLAVSLENTAAQELLRSLPGVGTKNYRHVMNRVGSIRELCELQQKEVEELLGVEPGRKLYDFLQRGLKGR